MSSITVRSYYIGIGLHFTLEELYDLISSKFILIDGFDLEGFSDLYNSDKEMAKNYIREKLIKGKNPWDRRNLYIISDDKHIRFQLIYDTETKKFVIGYYVGFYSLGSDDMDRDLDYIKRNFLYENLFDAAQKSSLAILKEYLKSRYGEMMISHGIDMKEGL